MAVQIDGVDGIKAALGTTFGPVSMPITQERVNVFADATDDHQWIHVDVDKANAESPFGGPIAHGFLTLSLLSAYLPQMLEVTNISMGVNYGLNKVRFPAPVPVGANLIGEALLAQVDDVAGGVQVTYNITLQVEGAAKPSCIAEFLVRYYS